MSRFQQAANLNNEGVTLLVDGKHRDAIASLSQAVQLLQMELTTAADQSSASASHDYKRDYQQGDTRDRRTSSTLRSNDIKDLTVEIPMTRKEERLSHFGLSSMSEDDDTHSVFRQALKIPTTTMDGNRRALQGNDCDHQLCTSFVIFNLALTQHFQVLSPPCCYPSTSYGDVAAGDDAAKMRLLRIKKAETLYCLVLKFLDDHMFANIHMTLVTKLACINNLFHLRYYSKGDYNLAYEEGARQLSQLLDQSPMDRMVLFSEPTLQGLLFQNLSLLLTEVPVVTAGAA